MDKKDKANEPLNVLESPEGRMAFLSYKLNVAVEILKSLNKHTKACGAGGDMFCVCHYHEIKEALRTLEEI